MCCCFTGLFYSTRLGDFSFFLLYIVRVLQLHLMFMEILSHSPSGVSLIEAEGECVLPMLAKSREAIENDTSCSHFLPGLL